MNPERLLERFLRYARIDTTADAGAESYPSSPGQLELGRVLAAELTELGLGGVVQTEHGIVMATLPATSRPTGPTICWCAHLDTSPETSGSGVRPIVWRNYDGGDLVLSNSSPRVIRAAEQPELAEYVGRTLVTSDGTTLLGADDKAGIAILMEAISDLVEHPEIVHAPIRLCFTCDEEIGRGVDHVDLEAIGAVVAYTPDGPGTDMIDVETFSADLAVVTIRGVNIHPSIGKGRMVNAVRAAADFLGRLPRDVLSPETTEGREGFLHPYHLEGGVAEVRVEILLRDFDTPRLAEQSLRLHRAADAVCQAFPGVAIDVDVRTQYRNMGEGLSREPRAVAYAEEAILRLGRQPKRTIIRGGTDGSRLTEMGLPTPNLSSGQHNPHSPLEWTCLEEMTAMAEVFVALAEVWAEKGDG